MKRPPGYRDDPNAGAIPGAMRGPPGKVRSPRNGRMVAVSSAQLEYGMDLDSVPVRTEAMHGGFWDFDQEAAMGPRRGPPRPPREDAELMQQFVERVSARLSANQLDVYNLFWVKRLSHAECAKRIGTSSARVYESIKRMRVQARGMR